ncbi:nitrate reductase molybdenum cofactor assembly chaperone [Geomonas sp. Red69]|uniref:Nitrate reductase molybdenum cofactor assembly chaperone n=1 Tax=Geomonas diazotrophica TaxID=2843197 RepID=A0ABX8JL05_9BACT|nr:MULTISPECIES: nitrate reductase molybdenum cofactor assembly chaperone [Geomonas]MBU5636443.1 nitrate reductase molybdenum cofactor assembly chaperone [Geomonas diazotrophica]QWV99055.1 nitrate reductase molybdenum cofactor assembly chaperone [Geomonas nitrogeniifigens]QXE88221.1 nitrate reductase molybdenum cofactor assembly chaperone [Geomonas nitrogeniifigens]
MSMQQSYQALSRLFEYPEQREELDSSYDALASYLRQSGIESRTHLFGEMLSGSTLSELQEDYVARFDFNPAAAPYLGHHLYGDNQKKGGYMIQVKQEYGRYDFEAPQDELPDHLGVVLAFLAHLARRGEDQSRREFIEKLVLPAINKLLGSSAQRDTSPWLTLVEAAELLCSADCREEATC